MTSLLLSLLMVVSANAHEDLESLECKNGKRELEVKLAPVGYTIQVRNGGTILKNYLIADFEIKDYFDQKYRQVFDIYTGKNQKVYLQVKRPETKGDITSTVAVLKDPPVEGEEQRFMDCVLEHKKEKPKAKR